MATRSERLRPRSEVTLRFEALLDRYPNLSEDELAELVGLYPYLRMVDRGLITVDERLSRKFAAFHRDHGRRLRASMAELALFGAAALLGSFFFWLFLS